MSAGTLAFLIFNRPSRGKFTKWIGCGISAVILIISVLLNVVPMARIMWTRHVGSTPVILVWNNTFVTVALIAITVLGVLWATRKALGDKSFRFAITAVVIVTLAYGATQAFGHGFSALADYGKDYGKEKITSPTSYSRSNNAPTAIMTQVSSDTWEGDYDPRSEMTGPVVPSGKTATIIASGTINAGDGTVSPDGGGGGGHPAANWYPVPGGMPNALCAKTANTNWQIVSSQGKVAGDGTPLSFIINDDVAYGDNSGCWKLRVTIQ